MFCTALCKGICTSWSFLYVCNATLQDFIEISQQTNSKQSVSVRWEERRAGFFNILFTNKKLNEAWIVFSLPELIVYITIIFTDGSLFEYVSTSFTHLEAHTLQNSLNSVLLHGERCAVLVFCYTNNFASRPKIAVLVSSDQNTFFLSNGNL